MNSPARISNGAPSAYQPLVTVLVAACAGIVLDRFCGRAIAWWWPLGVGACAAWWILWRRGQLQAAAVPLLIGVAMTAAAWHHCRWFLFERDQLALAATDAAEPTAIEARITSGPRRIPAPPFDALRTLPAVDRTRLELEVVAVRDADIWRAASGRVALFVDGHLSGVQAGDRLRVFGQLASIRQPANPGEFNFADHERARRQLCRLRSEFPECVSVVERGSIFNVPRWFDFLHSGGDRLLLDSLGPRRAGLAAAMFLGSREELDSEQTQAFIQTGTIHLLVISGLNVGILASCLFLAMRVGLIPRTSALVLVAVTTVLYAATTEAQPPVVRSTVMVLIACAAMLLGRRAVSFNSIAAAGLVVLALNPAELFHPGTQLSFLSVAVLAWCARRRRASFSIDPLDRLIARTRSWPERLARRGRENLWEAVFISFAIWVVICPLVMARFHLVSPVAIVLGPLLGIPVAVAMASGFGIFAVGWFMPTLAGVLGWICDLNLTFTESCVRWAQAWRGGHFWVGGPSDWWLAGFYGALAAWLFLPRLAPPRRWCLAILASWSAIGVMGSWLTARPNGELDCTFLSVGHGAAVVVELPGGQTLLYDAGRLGSPTAASQAVAGYLWSRGIRHLDAVVISHADADHYNALPALLRQFSVGTIYVSPVMFERSTGALAALQNAIASAGVPLGEVWSGDRLRTLGAATIDVLHPPRGGVLGSDNANSIVLSIEYQGRRVLLTGDLESQHTFSIGC